MNSEFNSQYLALEAGAHGCLLYSREPAEQLPAIVLFAQGALRDSERFISFADDHTIEQLEAGLEAAGVSVEKEAAQGTLKWVYIPRERRNGFPDPVGKVRELQAEIARARSEGLSGVRIVVEMTSYLGSKISMRKLRSWQAGLGGICEAGFSGRIVSLFKRSQLSQGALRALSSGQVPAVETSNGRISNGHAHGALPLRRKLVSSSLPARQTRAAVSKNAIGEPPSRAAAFIAPGGALRRTQAALEDSPDVRIELDRNWRFTHVNAATERAFDKTAAELLGKTWWDVFPETRGTKLESEYKRAISKTGGVCLGYLLQIGNRWFEVNTYRIVGGLGVCFRQSSEVEPAGNPVLAAAREEEGRVRDLRRLHAFSSKVAEGQALGPILEDLLAAALELHQTDLGVVLLSEAELGRQVGRTCRGLPEDFISKIDAFPPAVGASGLCYQLRRRIVIEDVEEDPLFGSFRETARLAGFRAAHSTPLIARGGKINGVISVYFREPRRPSEREMCLMDLFARLAADFIESVQFRAQMQDELHRRRRAEGAERLSAERFQLAAKADAITLFEQDRELQYTWLYPAHPEHTGALGKTDGEILGNEEGAALDDWKRAVMASGQPGRGEFAVRLPAGLKYYDTSVSLRRNEAGAVIGLAGVAVDVTERKLTEEALRASERRLRVTYARAPVGISELDKDGRFIAVNARMCEITGYKEGDLLGRSFAEMSHPEDVRVALENYQRLWDGELPFVQVEKRFLHKAGHPVWTNLVLALIHGDDGKPLFAMGIVQDISDRKRTEQKSLESEARFQAILSNSTAVIYLKDLAGRYILVNRQHEKMFGVPSQSLVGTTAYDLHPKELAEALAENDLKVIASGAAIELEEIIQQPAGTRTFLSVKFPLRNTEGKCYGVAGISTDITDRKRAEQKLQQRAQTLEILNRMSSALVAELDLGKIVQIVTDAGREVSGAQFGAFFYNVKNGRGESYTLHTLSGTPRSAFANLPISRSTEGFASTFHGEGVVRLGDVSQDPHSSSIEPLHGILKGGLPVRSYLSSPVVSRAGEVLGRLVFWHSAPDVFTDESETLLATLAAQAAISLDTAKLYAALQHELALQRRAEDANRRLAAIVESSEDAIISKGLDGIISSWNKGAQRIFGYTESEAIGKHITILIPPERQEDEPKIIERILSGERVEHFDTVRRHKDGSQVQISLSVSPIKNGDGVVVGASKIARDVTERKRIEQQQKALFDLAARVNRAEAIPEICDAAVDAIYRCYRAHRASILLTDADRVMRFKAWRNLSDGYRQAVEGHSPWAADDPDPQVVCIDDVAEVALDPSLRSVIEAEGIRALAFIPLSYEKRLLGKFMIYYNKPHCFLPEELRPAQAIASQVAFAIERQKSGQALELLINERTASLREAIAQMEEFSYSVSHDLRSPVRAMQGYANVLMEDYGDRLDPEGREFLVRIIRSSTRMDRLIQDVLTYSRLSRREIYPQPVSLDKLAREILQQYPDMHAPQANIIIDGPLHNVIGHEPSLSQVLSNLLSNAVKFVARGQTPIIHLRTEQRENQVRLWVEDNGIGIKPEYHHRLFGMFERVHPETKYEGTGIGPAIVRKAVERMGGKVGLESDGATGSKFWVQLPAA